METYEIKTIEELLEIVNEKNIECFKKDFCDWLDWKISLQKLNKADLPFAVSVEKTTFKWIDDGKTGVKIKIMVG